jgi:hypothetical protein
VQLRQDLRSDWSNYKGGKIISGILSAKPHNFMSMLACNPNTITHNNQFIRFISLSAHSFNAQNTNQNISNKGNENDPKTQQQEVSDAKESSRTKLKKAVKEYGATVIVFHVAISIISLGFFYTLVSR